MERNDSQLVEAFREGDRDAFALLIGRHRPRVVGLATALLGDIAAAEDVAQEATYHAYFDVERLRDPSRFGTWLCGIAVNLAKMALRRQRFAFSRTTSPVAGTYREPGSKRRHRPSWWRRQRSYASGSRRR